MRRAIPPSETFLVRAPSIHNKPSKSAQKKASRASRTEKKQQKDSANAQQLESSYVEVLSDSNASSSSPPMLPIHEPAKKANKQEPVPLPVVSSGDSSLNSQQPLSAPTSDLAPASTSSTGNVVSVPTKPSKSRREDDRQQQFAPPLPTKMDPQEAKTLKEKKWQNAVTRTLWTFIMIGGFIGSFLFHYPVVIDTYSLSPA
jgi:phosphatidate cytidylyltransferase